MQAVGSSRTGGTAQAGSEAEYPRKLRRFDTDASALDFGQLLQLAATPATTVVSANTIRSRQTSSSAVSASVRTGSVDKRLATPGVASNALGLANGKLGESSPERMKDAHPAAKQSVSASEVAVSREATGSSQMLSAGQRTVLVGRAEANVQTHIPTDPQNVSAQPNNQTLGSTPLPSAHLQRARNSAHDSASNSSSEGFAGPVHLNRTGTQSDGPGPAQVSLFQAQAMTSPLPSPNGTDASKPDYVLHIRQSDAPRELGDIVLRQVQAGPGEVRVKVHPEGMGDIVVSVQRHGDAVQVRLEGNQMQAVQWLSQQTEGITEAVKNAGVDVQSVEIAFGQANLSQGSGGEQPSKRQRDAQPTWSSAVSAGGRAMDTRFAIPEPVDDSAHVNLRV